MMPRYTREKQGAMYQTLLTPPQKGEYINVANTHGGPGRGQGLKPLFGEKVRKCSVKMPRILHDYLGSDNKSSTLRALLQWATAGQAQLPPDPGQGDDWIVARYSLSAAHHELAVSLGDGKPTVGIRRVVSAAYQMRTLPENS